MKFIKKGKVKNVYIMSKEEVRDLWLYRHRRADEYQEKGMVMFAEVCRKKADAMYQQMKAAGYFDKKESAR